MALTTPDAPVPVPPYRDLSAALAAFEELVDIVSGCVPVAIDDAADLGYEPIDAGDLAFSESDDSDRSGGHLESRTRARRRFTRLLLGRLLADDDIVLYPVPRPQVDTSGRPIVELQPALEYPGHVISDWWTSRHGVAVAVTHETDLGPGLIVDGRAISPVDVSAIHEYLSRDKVNAKSTRRLGPDDPERLIVVPAGHLESLVRDINRALAHVGQVFSVTIDDDRVTGYGLERA